MLNEKSDHSEGGERGDRSVWAGVESLSVNLFIISDSVGFYTFCSTDLWEVKPLVPASVSTRAKVWRICCP